MSAGFTSIELGDESLRDRARRMLADGFSPDELVEWCRDGVPVFEQPSLLGELLSHQEPSA